MAAPWRPGRARRCGHDPRPAHDRLACLQLHGGRPGLPSSPAQALPLTLDQIFPASVEISIVYRGPESRRAVGTVNARLERECQDVRARVPVDQTEQADCTVSARMAGAAHRQAKREFQNPAWHSDDLI